MSSNRRQSCTGETIKNVILTILQKFEVLATQVLMFVCDGDLSMLRAGRLFKPTFSNVYRTSVIAHTRNHYPDVNEPIAQTKAIFAKYRNQFRNFMINVLTQ